MQVNRLEQNSRGDCSCVKSAHGENLNDSRKSLKKYTTNPPAQHCQGKKIPKNFTSTKLNSRRQYPIKTLLYHHSADQQTSISNPGSTFSRGKQVLNNREPVTNNGEHRGEQFRTVECMPFKRSYSIKTLLRRRLKPLKQNMDDPPPIPSSPQKIEEESCTTSSSPSQDHRRFSSMINFSPTFHHSSSEIICSEILHHSMTLSDSALSNKRMDTTSESPLQLSMPHEENAFLSKKEAKAFSYTPNSSDVEVPNRVIDQLSDQTRPQISKSLKKSTDLADRFLENLMSKSPSYSMQTLEIAIRDSYGRFILNLPHKYLKNYIQLCFAIQEAYWWYIDYWYDSFPTLLPKFSMKHFGFVLFIKCPLLKLHFNPWRFSRFMLKWRRYCQTIPLKGAILVNNALDKVLMVQGWGGSRWMFPRGKVDEMEDDVTCAIREIREEIGVDVSKIINENVFIETTIDEQPLKLFVIPGILETTPFGPRKRKEISRIRWIPIRCLPGASQEEKKLNLAHKNAAVSWKNSSIKADGSSKCTKSSYCFNSSLDGDIFDEESLRFWSVHQFSKPLLGWITLLLRGSFPRQQNPSTFPDSCNVHSDWVKLVTSDGPDPYTFPSPPKGYNNILKERYSRLHEQKNTDDLSKQSRDEKEDLPYKTNVLRLVDRQPVEPKPQPLPPYVDDLIWYSIPNSTLREHVERLQHPSKSHNKFKNPQTSIKDDFLHLGATCADAQMHNVQTSTIPNNNSTSVMEQLGLLNVAHAEMATKQSSSLLKQHVSGMVASSWQRAETSMGSFQDKVDPQLGGIKFRSIVEDFQRFGLSIGSKEKREKPRRQKEEGFANDNSSAATSIDSSSCSQTEPLKVQNNFCNQNHQVSKESSITSTAKEMDEIQELSDLAQKAFEAVNSCRERLGQSKLSACDVINILGLRSESNESTSIL